jgi:sugar phosphate isomerase/epimerase
MQERKFAAIIGVYGKPSDRFMAGGYKPEAPDVLSRIQMAARRGLVRGVEFTMGEDDDIHQANKKAVQSALADHNLSVCAINPNLWGEPRWYKGTLGSTDPLIYEQALDQIKSAMDLAAELNCEYVGLWPGQDGYDYLFEVDYLKLYDQWVLGMQALADYNPAIKLGLEYKPYEPRTHSLIGTCPKTLLMLGDIDRKNVGLTLDVGHALYAHENLAEAVALSQRQGKLFHMHLNDNFADWDWDLNFGAVHLFDFIEMVYWLKRTAFDGWYSVDIFPYRVDGQASVDESLLWLEKILEFVESTGLERFDQFLADGDPLAVSKFFRESLFR